MLTKKGIPQGKVMNEGTGGQYSYFNGPKGKSYLPDHQLNAMPAQILQANGAAQVLSTVGRQNVYSSNFLMGPTLATTYTSDKFTHVVYEKAIGSITMNNIYLSNCYLIIYDIMARKDIGSGSVIGNPTAAWAQGVADEGTSSALQFLGSTPWQTDVFNQYYKVCQKTNVVLAAGATHVHNIRLNPNRLISSSYATYTPQAFADLTYWTFIEIHGSPANDVTTQTQVSVGVAGLNVIWDQEQTIKQIQKATPTLTTGNSLLTAFTVGEQVVNLGGSLIQAQAEG